MSRQPQTVSFWRGHLPHWEVEDGRYFVTMHLTGAIPKAGQDRIHAIAADLAKYPREADQERLNIHRRIFGELERWLDRTLTVSHLQRYDVAEMVVEAIRHRDGTDWQMLEFVVMPNHLHLFFELRRPGLKAVLEQFKRWTGHCAAKLLAVAGSQFWQDEWFDHWSRSDAEDERIAEYIRQNPVRAGLVERHTEWRYGSW